MKYHTCRRYLLISMDGKGSSTNYILNLRLWRSPKREEIQLEAQAAVTESRPGIKERFQFHNCAWTHQSLGRQTPDQVNFNRSARSGQPNEQSGRIISKAFNRESTLWCSLRNI